MTAVLTFQPAAVKSVIITETEISKCSKNCPLAANFIPLWKNLMSNPAVRVSSGQIVKSQQGERFPFLPFFPFPFLISFPPSPLPLPFPPSP